MASTPATDATRTETTTATNDTNTTNQDNSSVYKDLIEFLKSPRQDLRLEATKAVLQVIPDRNQVLPLMEHGVLMPLLRIVSDTTDAQSCENALRAILMLSSSVQEVTNQCVDELLQAKAVPRLIELVLSIRILPTNSSSSSSSNSSAELLNLALAILANLTRTEQGAVELVGATLPDQAITSQELAELGPTKRPTMELILDRFLNRTFQQPPRQQQQQQQQQQGVSLYANMDPTAWDTLSNDPYQHVAAILMNATQLESGRRFALRIPQSADKHAAPPPSVFQRLLPQLQHANPIRRRGISGMIRNCCLEQEAAWWMLNIARLMTPLLYPLAGPEELDLDEKQGMDPDLWLSGPDKVREVDEATRQYLVDAMLMLCATGRKSRETMRLARTYVVLKYADMVEESEAVSDRINECVQYLRRDEDGTAEGSSDKLVDDRTQLKLLPAPPVKAGRSGEEDDDADYDDVD